MAKWILFAVVWLATGSWFYASVVFGLCVIAEILNSINENQREVLRKTSDGDHLWRHEEPDADIVGHFD